MLEFSYCEKSELYPIEIKHDDQVVEQNNIIRIR